MGKLVFESREDVMSFINDHTTKNLDIGRQGRCVLLDNGQVAKYLYDDYTEYVLGFRNIMTKSYIFPKEGMYVGNYIVALLMDYAKGDTLMQSKPVNQDLTTLANNLRTLSYDTLRIGEQGVLVKDFHCGNIIYDGEQFKVIDTLPYLLLPGGMYQNDNLREVMNRVYACLLEEIMKYKMVWENHDYKGNMDALRYPHQYIAELKSYLERTLGEEIKTINEAEMVLKRTVK